MKNDILYEDQFAFLTNNSSEHAILQFTRNIAQNFNSGKFIDLSKAFDTVDHQILLKKIKHYRVNEKTLAWLRSYLFQRKKHVRNNNDIKYLLEIDCGVPQGSILGPLLFLICVNDFCLASKLKNIIFADDTNLLISYENIEGTVSANKYRTKKCIYLV